MVRTGAPFAPLQTPLFLVEASTVGSTDRQWEQEACMLAEGRGRGGRSCRGPLSSWPLVVVQDFLNGVCTNIIWLTERKLTYYTGNYDTFVKTVEENETVQQKKYEKEQDDIKHIKAFIASCGKAGSMQLGLAGH
jgi:hypothetical protein